MRVVLVHLGLSWVFTPYSEFFHNLLPVLFFVSGAVSFYSYSRSPGINMYMLKRLLSILGPYFVIAFLVILGNVVFFQDYFSLDGVVRWVSIIPGNQDAPFPVGQIWFIHAMVIIVITSFPIFAISKNSTTPLALCVLFSLALSVLHQVFDVDNYLYVYGHNTYQGLVSLGFFALGAIYVTNGCNFSRKWLALIVFVSVFVCFFNVLYLGEDINMANHSFAPDTYYLMASYGAISLVIIFKSSIMYVLNKFSVVDRMVLFFSKHAYSVFIVHSFAIYILEDYFDLIDVMSNPMLAALKIVLVFVISGLISIPITWLSNEFTGAIKERMLANDKKHEMLNTNVGVKR